MWDTVAGIGISQSYDGFCSLQIYTANQMKLFSIHLDFSGKVWNQFVYTTGKKSFKKSKY